MAGKSSKRDLRSNLALGKSLKKIWHDAANFESIPLTFRELAKENKFIAMPFPGDNNGHDGLLRASYIFIKIEHPITSDDGPCNAIRLIDGVPVKIADSEWVYLVK